MNIFPDFEVASCAAHVEAKRLANKLYTQWLNLGERMSVECWNEENKVEQLFQKSKSIRRQFLDVLRGLNRCCARVEIEVSA